METKPGYFTTEFWVTVFGTVYMVLNTTDIINQIPDTWATIALAVLGGLYSVGRGQAKQGVAYTGKHTE